MSIDKDQVRERRQAFWEGAEAVMKALFVAVLGMICAALVQEIYQAGRRAGVAECKELP